MCYFSKRLLTKIKASIAKRFVGAVTRSGPICEPEPFFSAEVASQVLLGLHNILPRHEPVTDSVDIAMSSSLERILNAATTLAGELQHSQVQPLHLVAAILAEESSEPADILKGAGISREAVIQGLRSQLA